jgi:hypothetical protein
MWGNRQHWRALNLNLMKNQFLRIDFATHRCIKEWHIYLLCQFTNRHGLSYHSDNLQCCSFFLLSVHFTKVRVGIGAVCQREPRIWTVHWYHDAICIGSLFEWFILRPHVWVDGQMTSAPRVVASASNVHAANPNSCNFLSSRSERVVN